LTYCNNRLSDIFSSTLFYFTHNFLHFSYTNSIFFAFVQLIANDVKNRAVGPKYCFYNFYFEKEKSHFFHEKTHFNGKLNFAVNGTYLPIFIFTIFSQTFLEVKMTNISICFTFLSPLKIKWLSKIILSLVPHFWNHIV